MAEALVMKQKITASAPGPAPYWIWRDQYFILSTDGYKNSNFVPQPKGYVPFQTRNLFTG